MRVKIKTIRGLTATIISLLPTQILIIFTWLFFRSESISQAGYFINRLLHWESSDLAGRFIIIVTAFFLIMFT